MTEQPVSTVNNDEADALGEAIVYSLDDRAVHSLDFIGVVPTAPIAEGGGRCQERIVGQFDMRYAGRELARQMVALGWNPPRSARTMGDAPDKTLAQRLQAAMAAEYAAGWPFYNAETRNRLGDEAARLNIRAVLAAIQRAGLQLTDAPHAD